MEDSIDRFQLEEACYFTLKTFPTISRRIAEKIVLGQSFYNPLTRRIQTKAALLKGNYNRRADKIQEWINSEKKLLWSNPD